MPSQKELKWSQLKVGLLSLFAVVVLVVLIFLMSGSTGGLFTSKIRLRAYFTNADGLKVGAPVTLDGVTIGNVTHVRILPHHEPDSVEVVSSVGSKFLTSLHTDSTMTITQAGVLGDAFLDISSLHASGPEPADNAVLPISPTPGIQSVIRTSQDSMKAITDVVHKVGVLVDSINNGQGTVGVLLNDKEMAHKIVLTVDQLQALSADIAHGKGSIGKLIKDDELYDHVNSTVGRLDHIMANLDSGQGTAGKLLTDDSLYKNLNQAIDNTNQLLAGVNAGKGSLGKLAKDPALAQRIEESVTRLNELLKGLNEGKGTLGQLVTNRQFFDTANETLSETGKLISAIRKDPKTYLTIHVKIF